ncbi:related to ARG2 - acetylglutamate synthase [Melanopsichium pennsylvanicum]|uniref:Amino-acid acetyltransferase, mitochondrial n=2 Tax=Melanopsichium pennsylvanicum TaxID=63383 RepID=A0AAJ4XSG6_9BASI|nr:related to ARG2-acetylglutamate synthase [Melanopsichium pennsylvanicum 4]SNX87715.1 related to ARG2 - acetylglutamate synthase [Melanopsichium pennsylvanicum]
MSKRMQNLIMEILQAQPSLRDSKTYLNSFAPRKSSARKPLSQANTSSTASSSSTTTTTTSAQTLDYPEFPIPPNIARPGSLHNPSTTTWDPQHSISLENDPHAHQSAAVQPKLPRAILDILQESKRRIPADSSPNTTTTTTTTTSAPRHIIPPKSSTVAIPQVTPVSDALADSHTALVKVQGPFTDRQLDSIAEGLVYLKRLGLVSVVVVDQDDWPDISADIDRNGQLVAGRDELEDQRMGDWLAAHPAPSSMQSPSLKGEQSANHGCRSSLLGRKQERLRKRIMAETLRLTDSLNRKGAMARPFPQAVVKVDANAAARIESEARPFQQTQTSGASAPGDSVVAGSSPVSPTVHYGSAGEERLRPPLVSDDSLNSIRSALASNQIPVLAPYALFENEKDGTLETLCVRADDVMVALTRDMVVAANRAYETSNDTEATASTSSASSSADPLSQFVDGEVDMMPLRLMVINREGGIPSHARGGDPHLSINLASEYHQIKQSFVWDQTHPTALRNLDAISDCLSYMPQTSSGVLVTHRSPRSLIANLITNKAAHSPSLPHRLLANKKDVRHTPTIIRPGLPIKVIQDFNKIDLAKMTALLEASFRRKLNQEGYYQRLREQLDFVIVTGDYQGAAVVTKEYAPDDGRNSIEPIAYLDKFAVLPSLQGSGTVDFLWGALRDEVQGLGLLDALNDNGGRGGYGTGRDLVWKSRSNNPVNRWYYERSNGFVRIDTDAKGTGWQLFWCDAEDKLARLSGERRLSASASNLEEAAANAHDDIELGHSFDDDISPHSDRRRLGGQGVGALESTGLDAYERSRRLSKPKFDSHLHRSGMSFGGGGRIDLTLLPIVAPEEGGRLLRWAKCMKTIKGAWAD